MYSPVTFANTSKVSRRVWDLEGGFLGMGVLVLDGDCERRLQEWGILFVWMRW